MLPHLQIHDDDGVRVLTIDRPEAKNALNGPVRSALRDALGAADQDDSVRAVVLTGVDPVFSAGVDFKQLERGPGESGGPLDITPAAALRAMRTPTICAVNGPCVSGALEMAMSCSFIIASEKARFADTHARVGILPSWGMSVRLPQAVGRGLALRMSLTGDYLSAYDALRVGLVTEVVLHDELVGTAKAVAASIVGNNRAAIRALLASYHRIDEAQTGEGMQIEAESAAEWLRTNASSDDIAANRAAVLQRGRSQIR